MKNILISFFLGYCFVPLVFYAVDMLCQETFFDGEVQWLFLLSLILVLAAVLSFRLLLRQTMVKVNSAVSAAVGASLGLLHGFNIYLIIGSFWVWKTMPAENLTFAEDDFKQIVSLFINPFQQAEYFLCDGSAFAIVFSIAIFFLIVLKMKQNKIKVS